MSRKARDELPPSLVLKLPFTGEELEGAGNEMRPERTTFVEWMDGLDDLRNEGLSVCLKTFEKVRDGFGEGADERHEVVRRRELPCPWVSTTTLRRQSDPESKDDVRSSLLRLRKRRRLSL